MTLTAVRDYLKYSVVLLVFLLPLGTSLKSIGIGISCGSLILLPICYKNLKFAYTRSFFITAGFLFAVAALSHFWSIAHSHQQFSMLEKYMKLLFIPFFALGFQNTQIRTLSLQAFLVSMWIVCAFSFYKFFFIHTTAADQVFNNHILTEFMMVFATYIASYLGVRSTGKWRWVYGITVLMFSAQIACVSDSRTGYVLYAILALFFFFQHMSIKSLRYVLLFGLVGMSGFIYFYGDNPIKQRITEAVTQTQQYHNGQKNTQMGYRFQFHDYAKSLFLTNPILGQGIGSFAKRFSLDNPIPAWRDNPDPHSQFWLTASELGILGIALLAAFFINLVLISLRLQETRAILQAMLLIFITSAFSECMLVNSAIGYLFIVFTALCMGEYLVIIRAKLEAQQKYVAENDGLLVNN